MFKVNSWMGYSLSLAVLAASVAVVGIERTIASTFSIKDVASQIAQKTDVPILLPSEDVILKYESNANYAYVDTSHSDQREYTVSFNNAPGNPGNAALRFSIAAKKDGNIEKTSPDPKAKFKNIQLINGSNALQIQQCGAACWSRLQWKRNGVLYEVWSKARTPESAIAIANSAIKVGDRRLK